MMTSFYPQDARAEQTRSYSCPGPRAPLGVETPFVRCQDLSVQKQLALLVVLHMTCSGAQPALPQDQLGRKRVWALLPFLLGVVG